MLTTRGANTSETYTNSSDSSAEFYAAKALHAVFNISFMILKQPSPTTRFVADLDHFGSGAKPQVGLPTFSLRMRRNHPPRSGDCMISVY